MELLLTIIIIRDVFLRDLARCNTNNCLRVAAAIDLGHENTKIRKSGKEVYVCRLLCTSMYDLKKGEPEYILMSVRLWNFKDGGS